MALGIKCRSASVSEEGLTERPNGQRSPISSAVSVSEDGLTERPNFSGVPAMSLEVYLKKV